MQNKKIFIIVIFIVITLSIATVISTVLAIYYYKENNCEEPVVVSNNDICEKELATISNEVNLYKVEIKGEVKNPGVYEIEDGLVINDLINIAGGLTKNAFTDNINLSKKLSAEMVIIIYDKNKYNQENKNVNDICKSTDEVLDQCLANKDSVIVSNNTENNGVLININTASIEELMSLPGVGQAKAENIITYRNTNGNFQNPEDILNVDGIGPSLYEKFKNNIQV